MSNLEHHQHPSDFFENIDAKQIIKQLLDTAPDGIIVVGAKGQILACNNEASTMFGYDADELLNRPINKLVPYRYRSVHETHCQNLFLKPEAKPMGSINQDILGLRKDGSELPLDLTLSPIKARRGLLIFCAIRDITERKQAEKTLNDSYKNLELALDGTVNVLALVIEKRDPYTAGHQQRVADLSFAIAKEMGLDDNTAKGVKVAGLLHDLGKIGIPIEILSKPGKISDQEFEVVKTHPQLGYEILKDVMFPWPVAEATYQHLERIDGSGYPRGLNGNEIIIEAKIIGLADVVEAMMSHRPYRPALGLDAALEEITKKRGTAFDEKTVDACIRLFKQKGFKLDS